MTQSFIQEEPGPGQPVWRLLVLQILPLLSLVTLLVVMVIVHERYQRAESLARAGEVAQFELKRITASFNYRLNELREEMLHLYGEQSNLARALNESERERLIFYRRDHLAAYAVLVPSAPAKNGAPGTTPGWDVQKYYLRDTARSAEAGRKLLPLFKEAMDAAKPPGFFIKRVEASAVGAAWSGPCRRASSGPGRR